MKHDENAFVGISLRMIQESNIVKASKG